MSVVSNPYIFDIKYDYNSYSEINKFISQSWTSPGTYTWTAPFTGIIQLEIAGAGGGGASYGEYDSSVGGNGNLLSTTYNIVANKIYTIIVGKGGASKSDADYHENPKGDPGESSSFEELISEGGGAGSAEYKSIQNGTNAGNGNGGKGSKYPNSGGNGWVKIYLEA